MTLVTGAGGFVGTALARALRATGAPVRLARSRRHTTSRDDETAVSYTLAMSEDALMSLVSGCRHIVHLAALVHEAGQTSVRDDFHAANVVATERLARAAAHAGVHRFVFLSTAKVFGERSAPGRPFTEQDAPRPEGAYPDSKWQAEQALARVARDTGLEVTILRPPLVFGPGVRANFLRLMDAVARGAPLPLGRVHNARSLVGLGNLVSAIERCLADPRAAGQTFVVADPVPIATADLVREIAAALEVRPRLLPVPVGLLRAAARAARRVDAADKLIGDFVVDGRRIEAMLDWSPPDPRAVTLARTAAWYRAARGADTRSG